MSHCLIDPMHLAVTGLLGVQLVPGVDNRLYLKLCIVKEDIMSSGSLERDWVNLSKRGGKDGVF